MADCRVRTAAESESGRGGVAESESGLRGCGRV